MRSKLLVKTRPKQFLNKTCTQRICSGWHLLQTLLHGVQVQLKIIWIFFRKLFFYFRCSYQPCLCSQWWHFTFGWLCQLSSAERLVILLLAIVTDGSLGAIVVFMKRINSKYANVKNIYSTHEYSADAKTTWLEYIMVTT